MEIHPLCSIFPDMSNEDFSDLCVSIAKNGIRQPVIVYKGHVIDGRHRQRAGLLLGVEIPYQEWEGEDSEEALIEFVADSNLHRRDLEKGQRAAIAVEIKRRLEVEYAKRRNAGLKRGVREPESRFATNCERSDSRRDAAAKAGVNHQYVSDAEKIHDASPELFEEVKQGRKSIPQAKRELADRLKPSQESTLSFDSDDFVPDPLTELAEKWISDLGAMKREFKRFAETENVLSRIDSLISELKVVAA